VKFKEKLERSHQHLIFRIEAAILDLKLKADSLHEFEVCGSRKRLNVCGSPFNRSHLI
jgi:hypothetical protein